MRSRRHVTGSRPRLGMLLWAMPAIAAACTQTLGRIQHDQEQASYVSLSSAPPAGATVRNLRQVKLIFGTPVAGASRLVNYRLEGAVGTLQVASVSEEADGSYLLAFTGFASPGILRLHISNVRDGAQRPVDPQGLSWQSQPSGPVLLSATPARSSHVHELNAGELCWDRVVTGAGLPGSYYILNPTGGNLAVLSVIPLANNCYQLSFGGTLVSGSYRLGWNDLTDEAGNPSEESPVIWNYDNSPPTIVTTDPASGSDISTINKIDIFFSEEVNGAGLESNYLFSGAGSGSLYAHTVNVLPDRYRLHVKGNAASGAIALTLGNITDKAGNPLVAPQVSFVAP